MKKGLRSLLGVFGYAESESEYDPEIPSLILDPRTLRH